MRAIHVHEYGPPSNMMLKDLPEPSVGPGQVMVKVMAAGVNPVDAVIRTGTYHHKPALPYIPGVDAAGVVTAVGVGVSKFLPGDRVYTGGTTAGISVGSYAELITCDSHQVHRLPDAISYAQGAAINVPYVTAHRAIFARAQACPGETVLVHGASGGVGIAAVQMARAHGMRVIGSAGTSQGQEAVLREGAHNVVDHTSSDYTSQIMSLTEGCGVDVIVEMAAHINLARDLDLLSKYGRIVVIGNRGDINVNVRPAMNRDLSILGVSVWNISASVLAGIHAALTAGLENGTLRPVVGRQFPLEDAARIHEEILFQPGALGKTVLLP